jgi:flagellar biosynthesis/type III secretory pathway M-ring protein FliF/YscJ
MNAAAIVTVVGAVLTLIGVAFTARATTRAAQATARANTAAAQAAAEPNQRAADLAAFQAIRDDMQHEIEELRTETRSLRSLVRAFAYYVSDLTTQMRGQGIEPPAPPARVDEYNRTGV